MSASSHTHDSFDGVTLSPDGRELTLDYSDPDQGATRLRSRYLISLAAPPRLITSYGPDIGPIGDEVGYNQIPYDVLRDAENWLRSNAEIAHASAKETLCDLLREYLEVLKPENQYREIPKPMHGTQQRKFKW